jgi:hypothetical protein
VNRSDYHKLLHDKGAGKTRYANYVRHRTRLLEEAKLRGQTLPVAWKDAARLVAPPKMSVDEIERVLYEAGGQAWVDDWRAASIADGDPAGSTVVTGQAVNAHPEVVAGSEVGVEESAKVESNVFGELYRPGESEPVAASDPVLLSPGSRAEQGAGAKERVRDVAGLVRRLAAESLRAW